MILFNILGIFLTIFIICFGLYFLLFKKVKNKYSLIIGYCYLLVGATIGLLSILFW